MTKYTRVNDYFQKIDILSRDTYLLIDISIRCAQFTETKNQNPVYRLKNIKKLQKTETFSQLTRKCKKNNFFSMTRFNFGNRLHSYPHAQWISDSDHAGAIHHSWKKKKKKKTIFFPPRGQNESKKSNTFSGWHSKIFYYLTFLRSLSTKKRIILDDLEKTRNTL